LYSIHLVNLSIATNTWVKPPGAVVNGPIISRQFWHLRKRLGWWYGDKIVSWDIRLLAEKLAVLASPQEVLSIGHCGGLPETSSVCFPH
jgi:hypothetical protein